MTVGRATVAAQPPLPVPARDRAREPKGWLATIAVALATIGVVSVGWLVSRAVMGLPIQPVNVSEGVRIYPPVEWRYEGPLDNGTGGEFSNGQGELIVDLDGRADEQAVAAAVRGFVVRNGAAASEVEPAAGAHGTNRVARFAFNGPLPDVRTVVEGEVFVVAGTNQSVVFIAFAGPGNYRAVSVDVVGMVGSATIP